MIQGVIRVGDSEGEGKFNETGFLLIKGAFLSLPQ